MTKVKSFLKKIRNSVEYTVLVRWVLLTELLCFLLYADRIRLPYNQDVKNEGWQKVQILEYFERTEKKKTVGYVRCGVVFDGYERTFTMKAKDALGKRSKNLTEGSVPVNLTAFGYLYSAKGGDDLYFYYKRYNEKELLARGKTFAWRLFKMRNPRTAFYLIIGFCIIFIIWIKRETKNNSIWRTNWKPRMAKNNYSSKAISQNPEYNLLDKEIFKKRYPPKIRSVAEGLKWMEFRISSEQTEAIREVFFRKKVPDVMGEYVDPRIFGMRVMEDATGAYAAQTIYRAYRGDDVKPELTSGQVLESAKEPDKVATESKPWQQLTGPIKHHAYAREAVLIYAGAKIPFMKRRKVRLLERTKEGQFAERKVETQHFYARKIPGNYVMVADGQDGMGIYEDVLKNEENPIMRDYEISIMKIRMSKLGFYLQQGMLFLISLWLLLVVWSVTMDWLIFPAIALFLVAVRSFKHFVRFMGRSYVKKYGPIVFECLFERLWKIPYLFLYLIMIAVIWINYVYYANL